MLILRHGRRQRSQPGTGWLEGRGSVAMFSMRKERINEDDENLYMLTCCIYEKQ